VVADRCTDATAVVAERTLGKSGRVIEVDFGCVGAARRIGTERSLTALRGAARADRTWIMATDADSVVPRDWIETHLRLAASGAHGVAGLVAVDSFADHHRSVEEAFRNRYTTGPAGEHPHVHGTNLGVRADAYLAAGGWRDSPSAEDHDLWNRLGSGGAPLISTIEAPVRTSGRAWGRAPDGFAGLLRSLVAEEIS
jgi:cellulose synthase/poly-beta-1,6-N-acetylglucosamine synthase-like glycosyltransferase